LGGWKGWGEGEDIFFFLVLRWVLMPLLCGGLGLNFLGWNHFE
jgi:hypothetical protein